MAVVSLQKMKSYANRISDCALRLPELELMETKAITV